MAATAYAAVVSLRRVLEDILHHAPQHILLHPQDSQSLLEKITFFQRFLEDYDALPMTNKPQVEDGLESEMAQRVDSIEKKLMMVKGKMDAVKDQQLAKSLSADGLSRRLAPTPNNTTTGLDSHLLQLKERLVGDDEPKLRMISVVGMGGIEVMSKYSDEQIGEQLRKNLYGRSYFIVMDDMWSIKVWDEVRKYFPDTCNKSRVVITTRLSNVAVSFDSYASHEMDFLDEDESWNLVCEKIFQEKTCPPELEEIGRRIAKSCKGLPLALVVIGGLLAKSQRTVLQWVYVAENLVSVINLGNDEQCLKILSLSYSHLPIYLKPCFLYMATFPEDCEIPVSRLVKLWIAEGFVNPIEPRSLEDIAMEYLKELIERNLLITLSTVENFRFTAEVIKRIPNIKKLKISYRNDLEGSKFSSYCLKNLASLSKLESLTLNMIMWREKIYVGDFAFPHSLKKLTLRECHLPWNDMRIVGSLSKLEILRLYDSAFVGHVWNPSEGEFGRLKFLQIHSTNLKYWGAENTHFPSLEHLNLSFVYLQELSLGLAEIHTLRLIELGCCKQSAVNSLKQIREERENLGYEDLQIEVSRDRLWDGF
ncbi:putative late blight resistance proteinR1B-19 [Sesamum alatum]|uniref:Late blight resistance proteinR1B-19 n=1 Tax=Sesamum alatum TaxID=300844 RepID=A0AAE2CWJ9_9LAMI|nr:putative late blight resistance proteinR1B-19 [Sesamum alatum]